MTIRTFVQGGYSLEAAMRGGVCYLENLRYCVEGKEGKASDLLRLCREVRDWANETQQPLVISIEMDNERFASLVTLFSSMGCEAACAVMVYRPEEMRVRPVIEELVKMN